MADTKLTALTALTSASTDDIIYVVDDPTGTPASKKITFDNFQGSLTKVGKTTVTQPATGSTIAVAEGKTFTSSNTITLTATDGSTLAIGTGGTLGTAAYTATTAYEASGAVSTHAALLTGVHGLAITAGKTLTLTNTLTFGGTDSSSIAFGTGGTVVYDNVTTLSSLASVGTITTGTWSATAIAVAKGGTALTAVADASVLVTNAADTFTVLTAGASQSIRRNAGNTAWEAYTPSGVAYGDSITGTTGTGLTISMGNNHAASGIGFSVTATNTQANSLKLININTGTSGTTNYGEYYTLKGSNDTGIYMDLGTASVTTLTGMRIDITARNVSGQRHNGIVITNPSTGTNIGAAGTGCGFGILLGQTGAGGTSLGIYGSDNVNTATNGLFNITFSSTQSGGSIGQVVDLGTSAQGLKGLSIICRNNSTSARGIYLDMNSSTAAGIGIEFVTNASGYLNRGIQFNGTLTGVTTATGDGIGIEFASAITAAASSRGFGIKFTSAIEAVASSTASYGIYMGNIGNATAGNGGRYMSFNNAQSSATLEARTNPSIELLFSRTSTATSGTVADNFDLHYMKRTSIMNGAGGTLTATGSILHLENVATQTAGTLTDNVPLLKLTQDNDSIGGHILFTAYSGTPTTNNTLWYDGTNIKYINNAGVTKTVTVS